MTKVVRPCISWLRPSWIMASDSESRLGGFVENQNARLGEECACNGQALALAAGEFDAALADDSVVAFGKALGEFIDARDAAGEEKLLFGGVRGART